MPPHSLEDAIGRMLMVGVRGASIDDPRLREDLRACCDARVGGVVLFDVDLPEAHRLESRGAARAEARRAATRNILDAEQTRRLIASLRDALGPDLLIAVDQEGGAVQRLSPARGFVGAPAPAEYASLAPAEQQRIAADQAGQLRSLGFNATFSPCVDLAINPRNPIIAALGRAFGAAPESVVAPAMRWIEAHAAAGVATCLKHFPGHGCSASDSHLGLADITDSAVRDTEARPYQRLIDRFAPSPPFMVMTGHLLDRRVDPHLPASLSRAHTTERLRERLGFDGVVIVDSLDMRAVADRWGLEEACVLALQAGADIVLDCVNAPGPSRPCPAPRMRDAIASAVRDGRVAGGEAGCFRSAARLDALLARVRAAPAG